MGGKESLEPIEDRVIERLLERAALAVMSREPPLPDWVIPTLRKAIHEEIARE